MYVPALAALEPRLPAPVYLSTGHCDDKLVVYQSPDGITLSPVTRKATVTGNVDDSIRDSDILYYNGRYWICHTVESGMTGRFGILVSDDLVNWEHVAYVTAPTTGGPDRIVWAPNWLVVDGVPHCFCSLAYDDESEGAAFAPYETHPLDAGMTTWSEYAPVTCAPANSFPNAIDFSAIEYEGTYYLIFSKVDANKYTCLATSSAPFSGYTIVHDGSTDFSGLGSGDGHFITQVGDAVRIYCDKTGVPPNQNSWYVESADGLATWSSPRYLNLTDYAAHLCFRPMYATTLAARLASHAVALGQRLLVMCGADFTVVSTSGALVNFATQPMKFYLPKPGLWLLQYGISLKTTAATITTQCFKSKLRRTNNTAADIANTNGIATNAMYLPPMTEASVELGQYVSPPTLYRSSTTFNDYLYVYGWLSGALGAGSLVATQGWILAIYLGDVPQL